jgi:anti-sigma B factor antagonist
MAELNASGRTPVSVSIRQHDGVPVISLAGELDLTNVEEVRTAIKPALGGHDDKIVFELGELTFLDSAGLALLVSAARQAHQVELRNPAPIVRRLVTLTGLSKILLMAP